MKRLIIFVAAAGLGFVLILPWIKEPATANQDSAAWQRAAPAEVMGADADARSGIVGFDTIVPADSGSARRAIHVAAEPGAPPAYQHRSARDLIEAYLSHEDPVDFSLMSEADAIEFHESMCRIARQMEYDLLASIPDPSSDSITAEEAWSAMESGEAAYVLPVTNDMLARQRKPKLLDPRSPRYIKANSSADPRFLRLCMLSMEFQDSPASELLYHESQRKFESQLPPDYPYSYSDFQRTRDAVSGSTILRSPDGRFILEHASSRIGWPRGPRRIHNFSR
jgi:hypothetical protein